MSFTEVGQTTFSCKCHSLLGSSQTPHTDAENTMNCLRSNLESVPKSTLAHGTISFATTREQVCLEPATTRLHKHMCGHFITNSPSQAERGPGKDVFLHWWPNILDPLMRAWLPAGPKPKIFSYSSTSYYHQNQSKNPWITNNLRKKPHTHKKNQQPTDTPDLVSSKTEMTTPKTLGE